MLYYMCLVFCHIVLLVNGRPYIVGENIFDEIFNQYNKYVRPATDEAQTVIVRHGFHLIKILECDGTTLKAETWLPLSWTDPRLVWSLDDYNQKTLISSVDQVWTPDIVLLNNPSYQAGNAYSPRVSITNQGGVYWLPVTTIATNCQSNAPYSDTISCVFTFGSWTYDGSLIDIYAMYDSIDVASYVDNSQWEYVTSTTVRNVKTYPGLSEPYIDVTYNITIRERVSHKTESVNTSSKNGETSNSQRIQIQIFDVESEVIEKKEESSETTTDGTNPSESTESTIGDR